MSILDRITTELSQSMKSGDTFQTDLLRMVKSALMNAKIAKPDHQLSESDEMEIIQKEIKKRTQSAEMFRQGSRTELAEKEDREAKALEVYLPAQMSDEEIESAVTDAIKKTGATSSNDMGKVMGTVMPMLKGKAESSRIATIVQRLLNQ